MIDPMTFFLLLLKASLFSTSGTGNFPIVHQDFTELGWATEQEFAESLAIGQITPGPTGFWVIVLGQLSYGIPGALLASLAISLPPMVVLLINRVYQQIGHHPATPGFIRGLTLAALSSFFVVMTGLFLPVAGAGSIAIVVATVLLTTIAKLPPLPILLLAGVAGMLIYR